MELTCELMVDAASPACVQSLTAPPTAAATSLADSSAFLQKALIKLQQQLEATTTERDGLASSLSAAQAAATDRASLASELEGQLEARSRAEGEAARLSAALQAAQTAAAEADSSARRSLEQAAQWKRDREAAEVGRARAEAAASLAAQRADAAEAEAASLRAELKSTGDRLAASYEKEAGLLAELGALSEQLRQAQEREGPRRICGAGGSASARASPEREQQQQGQQEQERTRLDELHRNLFLAAAAQMSQQYEAQVAQVCQQAGRVRGSVCVCARACVYVRSRVGCQQPSKLASCPPLKPLLHHLCLPSHPLWQASNRAEALGVRLEGVERAARQAAASCQELRARAEAAEERCTSEQEAAAALLASNLQLHEAMLQLFEAPTAVQQQQQQQQKGQGGWLGPTAQEAVRQPPPLAKARRGPSPSLLKPTQSALGRQQQAGGWGGSRLASEHRGGSGGSRGDERIRAHLPPQPPHTCGSRSSQQGMLIAPARTTASAPQASSGGSGSGSGGEGQAAAAAAEVRRGAVAAALAIAAEHRQLHERYAAAAAEAQRFAGCIAVAAPGKLRALQAQHDAARGEALAAAAALERKALQLAALRQAGLL